MHLVARCNSYPWIVGALTVVDTTRNPEALDGFDLPFSPSAASARLTNLAVLRRFRGMGIPARLLQEAMTRFVRKRNIEYTWLCYDASRAANSWLCRDWGFQVLPPIVQTQFGAHKVLMRDEFLARADSSFMEAGNFAGSPAVRVLTRKAS
jgi:ribosomal protein S18 acetylase RimI-like enzyme